MLTTQERADLLEIYGSLDSAYEYFQEEEADHNIFPRFQAEMRQARIAYFLEVCMS
jgi:hypothetical protein